jgi:hypothetical protein
VDLEELEVWLKIANLLRNLFRYLVVYCVLIIGQANKIVNFGCFGFSREAFGNVLHSTDACGGTLVSILCNLKFNSLNSFPVKLLNIQCYCKTQCYCQHVCGS